VFYKFPKVSKVSSTIIRVEHTIIMNHLHSSSMREKREISPSFSFHEREVERKGGKREVERKEGRREVEEEREKNYPLFIKYDTFHFIIT